MSQTRALARSLRIAASFDRAVDYDQHAVVQALVAKGLADKITAYRLPMDPKVLEIGCGTGLLGAALIDRMGFGRWLMTDISSEMLDRARKRFGERDHVGFARMDGESPSFIGPFDLICSNLAFQWFVDLPRAIARLRGLLAPGGVLAFSTLLAGTFSEWQHAHGEFRCGSQDYPDAAALRRVGLDVQVEKHVTRHRDGREFLAGLKAIGAGTPKFGHHPLSPAQLRRILTRFEDAGASATYVVGLCTAAEVGRST